MLVNYSHFALLCKNSLNYNFHNVSNNRRQRMGLCAVANRSFWQLGRKKPFLG